MSYILINVDFIGSSSEKEKDLKEKKYQQHKMILSAKSSLVKYAQQIPAEISQMHPNSVVHVSATSNIYELLPVLY
jgi:hypothetical protein